MIITPGYLSCRWQMENVDFLQPLSLYSDNILQPWHITQTGYFVCRWQTLQHLVLIMLNAQLERVTSAVQVYDSSILGVCWFSSASLRSVHTRRQVAATCHGNTLQQQIASCVLENFCENLCRRNKSHRFSLIWGFVTCCSDKMLLRRQRFSQKFSEAICRCDVSPHLYTRSDLLPRRVAATCRLVCTDLYASRQN